MKARLASRLNARKLYVRVTVGPVPRTGKKPGLPSPGGLAIRPTWSSVTVMA